MAGTPTLAVDITAIDNVTAVINKINARMAAFSAPMEKLGKSVSKFGDVSGLTRMGRAFGNIATEATGAFQAVGQIIAPLGIISGAASIAGIYRMVSAWSEWGTHLGNAATRIGISAQALSGFQGAARLAGVSAEGMTSGLQTLGQTMYDAIGGRAPEAVAMFNTLGIAFRDASGHARSVTDVLPQVADKIAGIKDPFTQAKIATAMFGGAADELLPFLRRGSAGIREYTAMAERYGVGSAAAVGAANQFRMAQTRVALAVEGLANSVSQQLAPVISPLLTQMADWIAANRDWIATGIGREVRQFAAYVAGINWIAVGQGVQGWVDGIGSLVQSIGGWHTAIGGVIGLMAAPLLSSVAGVATALFSLAANPVGAVVLALGGLAYAGYKLYEHWDDVKAKFSGLWDGLKTMFENNTGYIRTAAELLFPLPTAIIGHWNDLKDYFPKMWDGIKGAFDEGWSYIKPIIDKLQNGVNFVANSWLGKKLGYAASAVGDAAGSAVSGAVAAAPGFASRAVAGLDRVMGFNPDAVATSTGGGARHHADGKQWAADLAQLQGLGWSRQQAAGILGNTAQESGGDAGAVGDGGKAYGLQQWHADRQANFAKLYGHDIRQGTHAEQIGFIDHELRTSESRAGNALKASTTVADAAHVVRKLYERPADAFGYEDSWRTGKANKVLLDATVANQNAPATQAPPSVGSAPERQIASQPPSVSSADLKAAMNSRVNIDINGRTPPGISVTASGSDNVNLGGGLVQQSRLGMVAG